MVNVCGIVALVGISVIVFAFLVLLAILCYGYNKVLNYILYVLDPETYPPNTAPAPTSDSSTDEISFDELEEFVVEK